MSNILPHEAKKAVWSMYRVRFIIAGSLMALLAAGLCALSLLPSYLALHAADIASAASSTTPPKVATDADRAAIVSLRALLTSLSPLIAGTTSPSTVITQALSLRPSTILIDHITYAGGNPGTIIIAGSAATREAINGYRQVLSADSHWKSVSIPIGDLTGEPGARFSLTLSGSF